MYRLLFLFALIAPLAINAQVASFQHTHRGSILEIKFSPDGSKLLSYSSGNQDLCMWEVQTGRLLWQRPISFIQKADEYYTLNGLAWSSDQAFVATASGNGTVQLWDARTGKFIWRSDVYDTQLSAVAFSPDGKTIAATAISAETGTVKLIRASDGTIAKTLTGTACTGIAIAFEGDKKLRVGNLDGNIAEWDLETGKQRAGDPTTCGEMRSYDWDTSFSRDLRLSVKRDGTQVAIKDTVNNRIIQSTSFSGKVRSSASEDGSKVVIADYSAFRYVDTKTLDEQKFDSCVSGNTFDLSPDGNLLAQACSGFSTAIRVTAIESGKVWYLDGHPGHIRSIAYGPDGSQFAAAGNDGNIYFFDPISRNLTKTIYGKNRRIIGIAFTPDGKTLISVDEDVVIRKWDVSNGEKLAEVTTSDRRDDIEKIEVDKNGTSFFVLLKGSISLWNVARLTPRFNLRTVEGFSSTSGNMTIEYSSVPIMSAVYSPDGRQIITGLEDGTLRTWDPSTGQQLSRFQIGKRVSFVNRIGKTRNIVALVEEKKAKSFKIIDPLTGSILRTSKNVDLTFVETVTVSNDGRYLMAVDNIGTVKVWTLSDLVLQRKLDYEYSGGDEVAFSPDSKTFYIGGENQNIFQYESATGRKLWQLLPDFEPAESETKLVAEKDKLIAVLIEAKNKREKQAAIDVPAFREKVYIKFDHFGSMSDPGEKRIAESDEPKESKVSLPRDKADAVWLTLHNDSPLPIEIPTQSMYFPNPKCFYVFPSGEKMVGLCEKREISIWHGLEDSKGKSLPYGFDFGSSAVVLPNSSVLFPVPLALLRNGNSIAFDYSFQNVKVSKNDQDWDYGEKVTLRFAEKNIPK